MPPWVDIDSVAEAAEVLRWRYLYSDHAGPWIAISYGAYLDAAKTLDEGERIARVREEGVAK